MNTPAQPSCSFLQPCPPPPRPQVHFVQGQTKATTSKEPEAGVPSPRGRHEKGQQSGAEDGLGWAAWQPLLPSRSAQSLPRELLSSCSGRPPPTRVGVRRHTALPVSSRETWPSMQSRGAPPGSTEEGGKHHSLLQGPHGWSQPPHAGSLSLSQPNADRSCLPVQGTSCGPWLSVGVTASPAGFSLSWSSRLSGPCSVEKPAAQGEHLAINLGQGSFHERQAAGPLGPHPAPASTRVTLSLLCHHRISFALSVPVTLAPASSLNSPSSFLPQGLCTCCIRWFLPLIPAPA